MKTKVYILLYILLIIFWFYCHLWWLAVIGIIIGLLIAFLIFLCYSMELGLRNKFPLDFLIATGQVNQYFIEMGYTEIGYDLKNSNYPATDLSNGKTNVKVRLNAPLFVSNTSISVISEGEIVVELNMRITHDEHIIRETLDPYFNK